MCSKEHRRNPHHRDRHCGQTPAEDRNENGECEGITQQRIVPGPASNLRIAAADIHGMSSPEQRLMKAVWGKTEVMYDRRQKKPRRTGWRGGRRASDWPEMASGRQKRQAKPAKSIM
jgi:hypothetical protein